MAISHVDFSLLVFLRRNGLLPRKPQVLELGKSNWYNDVPLPHLVQIIHEFVEPLAQRESLLSHLDRIAAREEPTKYIEIADVFYRAVLDYTTITAIDWGDKHSTYRFDLNQPVPLKQQFELVLNFGTAEHIFDVCQFFRTVHDMTLPGGLMIHGGPFLGWIDHGFYNFQPTLFLDLAGSNGYEVLILLYADLQPPKLIPLKSREHIVQLAQQGQFLGNSLLHVVFRKGPQPQPFKVPMQAYYSGKVSQDVEQAWLNLR